MFLIVFASSSENGFGLFVFFLFGEELLRCDGVEVAEVDFLIGVVL